MNWAQRLKRVFGIDIEACARCGGKFKVIASIEEPAVVAKILAHLEKAASDRHQTELPLGARAPSDVDTTEVAKIQKKVEGAKVRLAKENGPSKN